MLSWWYEQNASRPSYGRLEEDRTYGVAVVGGGLVGAVTALLLARAGRSVVLLEARRVAAGTTGGTTGKVSLLQGTRLSTVAGHRRDALRGYVEANRSGQEWIRAYCEATGVAYDVRDAVTYASTARGEERLRDEQRACTAAGLEVVWETELGLPYDVRAALRLPGQGQIDAVALTDRIVADAVTAGAEVFEDTRVLDVVGECPRQLRTERATVRADQVVLATGIPILDRGGFFARLSPQRSYAAAFGTQGPAVDAMLLSVDQPTRSLRTSTPDPSVLIVGGNGHTTGRVPSEAAQVADLIGWAQGAFGVGEPLATWSAQDYRPTAGLPYVGRLLPHDATVQVATGFDKWGMAMGAAAGLALAADLAGDDQPPWRDAVRAWRRPTVRDATQALRTNASVGLELGRGWLGAAARGSHAPPAVHGVPPRADAGGTSKVSAICTHLGGIVEWNDAERTWDCPLHGSRFAEDGAVVEGPATRPLPHR